MTATTPLNFYLAVHKPESIWTARLASLPTDPYMTISYNSAAQVRAPIIGETVWFGSAAGLNDLGTARLRTLPNGTSFTVGLNSTATPHLTANCYITIKEEFRLWPIYPKITGSTSAAFAEDYNIPYTDQNSNYAPMALIGPPAAGFMTTGTVQYSFIGERSYNLRDNTTSGLTFAWTAVGSDEGTSTAMGTQASPVVFTWHTAGTYLVSLAVTDTVTGKTTTTHSYAFVFDPTDTESGVVYSATKVYQKFDKASISADYFNGGSEATFVINGPHDVNQFPEGTMVLFFYTGNLLDRTAAWPYRNKLLYIGWIIKDTVTITPNQNNVQFSTQGIIGLLKNTSTFPITLEDKTSPTVWPEMKGLCITRIFAFIAQQRSTLSLMSSFMLMPNTKFMKFYDTEETNLYGQLSKLAHDHFANVVATMQGVIYPEINYQYMLSSERSAVTQRKEITSSEWRDNLGVDVVSSWSRPVSLIKVDGVAYDSNPADDVDAYIAKAPGDPLLEQGQARNDSGFRLLSQAELNARAGLIFGQANNKYPIVRTNAINDGSFDVAPQEVFPITIVDDRVIFNQRLSLPRRVRHTLDPVHSVLRTNIEFEPDSTGASGTTVIIPAPITATFPPPPVLTLPPFNLPPLPTYCPPGTFFNPATRRCEFGFLTGTFSTLLLSGTYPPIGWHPGTPPDIAYLSTASGVYLTNNFSAPVPTWVNTSSGLTMNGTYGFHAQFISIDPRDPDYQYCLDNWDFGGDGSNNAVMRKSGRGIVGTWSVVLDSSIISSSLGYSSAKVMGVTISHNKSAGWVGAFFRIDTGPEGTSFENSDFYFTYSLDRGTSWQPAVLAGTITRDGAHQFVDTYLFGTYSGVYKDSSSIAPGNLIYIIVSKSASGAPGFGDVQGARIFVSEDSGATWSTTYENDSNAGSPAINVFGSDSYVRVDPTNPQTLFATNNNIGESLMRSTSRGNSWTTLGNVNSGDADRYLNNGVDTYTIDQWNIAPIAVTTGSTFSTELYSFCVTDNPSRNGIFNNSIAKFTWDNFLGVANPITFITASGIVLGTNGLSPTKTRTFGMWNDHRDTTILYAMCLDSMLTVSGVTNADAILYMSVNGGFNWSPKTSNGGGIPGLTRWTYGMAVDYGVITGSSDFYSYQYDGNLYHIERLIQNTGTATSLPNYKLNYDATYNASAFARGVGKRLAIIGSNTVSGDSHVFFGSSVDGGVSWIFTDSGVVSYELAADSDRQTRDSMWVVNAPGIVNPYKTQYAWHSSDGGVTWGSAITVNAGSSLSATQTLMVAPGANYCYLCNSELDTSDCNVIFYRINQDGTVEASTVKHFANYGGTSRYDYPGYNYSIKNGCVDPTNPDRLYIIGSYNNGFVVALYTYIWSTDTLSVQVLPNADTLGILVASVYVTDTGTILVAGASNPNARIWRSTNQGTNWTEIDVSSYFTFNLNTHNLCPITSIDGITGAANDTIVLEIQDDKKFLFSEDDGQTWKVTADLLGTATEVSNME